LDRPIQKKWQGRAVSEEKEKASALKGKQNKNLGKEHATEKEKKSVRKRGSQSKKRLLKYNSKGGDRWKGRKIFERNQKRWIGRILIKKGGGVTARK